MLRKSPLVLALLASLLAPAAASAATFTVTTPADGNATCTAIICTLRAALAAATTNGSTADDTITVPAGTYTLDSQFGTLNVPASNTRITIAGAGATTTIIQPNAAFRLLLLNSGSALTLSGVTLSGGQVTSGYGGNIQVSSAALTLIRARVTGGQAQRGGGIHIAAGSGGSLNIAQSLIDGNTATATANGDVGGGIFIEGQTFSAAVTIQDSTITGNRAQQGGAIGVVFNGSQTPVLRGVTIARNTARATTAGVGGILTPGTIRVQGSILDTNTFRMNFGAGSVDVTTNCSLGSAAVDEGGNVESGADCGLATGRQNTDAQLSAALDTTASPPVLSIPAASPAVDFAACGARTADQRGVARPQGAQCDAGAFEYKAPDPVPTPTPTATATATAPPVVTPTATPTPTPTPVFHSTVVSREVSGRILVRRPGTSNFVELDTSVAIPLGSTVDARKGKVEITSVPSRGGKPESARFYDGMFKITQPGSITQLELNEPLAPCKRSGRASAAATKAKKRKLWGDGKGKFRTKGAYSAATVRGTKWYTEDTCAGTLTRVTSGVVSVRDNVRHKTILVRPGKPYRARPKR